MNRFRDCACVALLALGLAGCRSPEAWRRNADEAAARAIAGGQRTAFGAERPFTIERPSDTLRQRLGIGALTNAPAAATNALVLTLADCLAIGARNSPEYQDRKEQVFRAALALDLEQHAFENSYAGLLSGGATRDGASDPAVEEATGSAGAGFTRKLKSGATLSTKLTFDVVRLLTGDGESSLGLLADASITIPLLKDAGREVVTEPLTQAERDLVYELLLFERYKADFAVQIASSVLSALLAGQQVTIAEENLARLNDSLGRAEALGNAGRTPATDVDQTRQNVLRARSRLVTARQQAETRMDELMLTLGLPVDAPVRIDGEETRRIAGQVEAQIGNAGDARPGPEPDERAAIGRALENRQDLLVQRRRVEDAERQARVAAAALRAGLDVTLSASGQRREYSGGETADLGFGDGTAAGRVDVDLPWERTSERNAYRNALLRVDKARRDLASREDEVKKSVRDALRSLHETRETYRIQRRAVELAERRVRSTAMFLEAGRAETRDVLEATEALVNAQNDLAAAVVARRQAQWILARDTGAMIVGEDGMWNLEEIP